MQNSLSKRLSLWLAIQTLLGLILISLIVYFVCSSHLNSRRNTDLNQKQALVMHLAEEAQESGDFEQLYHNLEDFMAGHHELSLEIRDAAKNNLFQSDHSRADASYSNSTTFAIRLPGYTEQATATITYDNHLDTDLLRQLAITLATVSAFGALVVSLIANALVKRAFKPVDDLAIQTASLNATSLSSQLDGSRQPDELQPLVIQFNQLIKRLAASYNRLENFNADVAHELNTPLTTLITSTELALRKPQSTEVLYDLLGSNLEELHGMSEIVRDMLFLSQAESGSRARCEVVESLAAVAIDVTEYYEAVISDAGLATSIKGDVSGEFDLQLIKRALSNLLSNAVHYSEPESTIEIVLGYGSDKQVSIAVANTGAVIPADKMDQIFDRFYRVDESRSRAEKNHGLGLSIVAGIARMHGGVPFAFCTNNKTTVGMRIPKYGNKN